MQCECCKKKEAEYVNSILDNKGTLHRPKVCHQCWILTDKAFWKKYEKNTKKDKKEV